ncbi:MAG TPA: urate hydroxylase PuuD [Burkholderiales bacterium]|nr:urate hydroxylase PuuD [Burkholderiales bacterium]
METYLLDWLNLLVRWAHVIVGIAWIGASFYFIWLDDRLEASPDPQVAGELWAIHGGGFYSARKYRLAPAEVPATLHWFKWEAYWTWITGFALLVLMYYVNAELYLIDPAVMALSKPAAIGLALGSLILGLIAYEAVCRSPLGKNEALLSAVIFLLLALAAWGLAQVFSGRGAFIHYGAILGTIMAANVAHVIIPGQRRMVQAMREGREPDAKDSLIGKQRSVHNTYFTLPVVFVMISNHYASVFGHRWGWLALVALTLAGALIRVWFVLRHKASASSWVWILGVLCVLLAAALVAPPRPTVASKVDFSEIRKIVDTRCVACHAEKPSFQGMNEAPKGVKLDTDERIRAQAAPIHQQTVLGKAMPPGNLTAMTQEERQLLDRWYRAR